MWGPFTQAVLKSVQGRTSAVLGFAVVISNAWKRIVFKVSHGLANSHSPPSVLLSPETRV